MDLANRSPAGLKIVQLFDLRATSHICLKADAAIQSVTHRRPSIHILTSSSCCTHAAVNADIPHTIPPGAFSPRLSRQNGCLRVHCDRGVYWRQRRSLVGTEISRRPPEAVHATTGDGRIPPRYRPS